MKEFVELVNKYFHLRTAHSELVGFWTVELGAMNKAVHVWKYGTLGIPLCAPCASEGTAYVAGVCCSYDK